MSERAPRRLPRRLAQLYAGLLAFAFGEAMIVRAGLGVMSWDVLHQGLARHLGLSIGQWSIIVGALVLLLWIPLRERPGWARSATSWSSGCRLDVFLAVLSAPASLPARVALLVAGILLNGVATAAYVGARPGPGPARRADDRAGAHAPGGRSAWCARRSRSRSSSSAGCSAATSPSGRSCSSSPSGRWSHVFLPLLTVGERPAGR